MLKSCSGVRVMRSQYANVKGWKRLTTVRGIQHQSCPLVAECQDEPLRILFCGSDSFSCSSLEALYRESQRPSTNIASIDVVCREGKPYGRGLKSIRHRMCSTQTIGHEAEIRSGNQGLGQKPGSTNTPDQNVHWLGGMYMPDGKPPPH